MKDDPVDAKSRNTEIVIKGMKSGSLSISYLKIQLPWGAIAAIVLIAVASGASKLTTSVMHNACSVVQAFSVR